MQLAALFCCKDPLSLSIGSGENISYDSTLSVGTSPHSCCARRCHTRGPHKQAREDQRGRGPLIGLSILCSPLSPTTPMSREHHTSHKYARRGVLPCSKRHTPSPSRGCLSGHPTCGCDIALNPNQVSRASSASHPPPLLRRPLGLLTCAPPDRSA